MTNKRYQKEALGILEDVKTYRGKVNKSELVELIRKYLVIASLEGASESLKENR